MAQYHAMAIFAYPLFSNKITFLPYGRALIRLVVSLKFPWLFSFIYINKYINNYERVGITIDFLSTNTLKLSKIVKFRYFSTLSGIAHRLYT